MNEMTEINKLSWRLASVVMISLDGKIVPYSTSQIRKIMNVSNAPDSAAQIRKLIESYNPAPPQRKRPEQSQRELRLKKEKNTEFGKLLLDFIVNQNPQYVQSLLRYTIWNIKIIENGIRDLGELELILDCEGVKEKELILSTLKTLKNSENRTGHGPRRNTYQKQNFRRNY
ncbi:hypothetical protein [Methanomethylovorans sp.]|uniref:hypothetical protein n=1 Tax=Methanomethylovorans sp. TaxID=2758717 RepID=UPI00345E8C5A